PSKRPTSKEIIIEFEKWVKLVNDDYDEENFCIFFDEINGIFIDKSENEIEKQFLESDKINENLPIIKEKFNNIYTSKPYNTINISSALSKLSVSKSAGIEIPDDI
ncbi:9079_t:CDS:1, partial [Dentiscutata heterogama]